MKISKDDCVLEVEELLLRKQNKKLKKHYLKSNAKAFIHKFRKILKQR